MKVPLSYIKVRPGSESAFKDWLVKQEEIRQLDRNKCKVELHKLIKNDVIWRLS